MFLFLLTFMVGSTPAATVFHDDFESGSLSTAWIVSATGDGRARAITDYGPAAGQYHMVLDDSVSDALYSTAAATLRFDLTHKKNVILSFNAKSLGNEPDYPAFFSVHGNPENFDGVSVSMDSGETWQVVEWLVEVGPDWETFSVRLDDYTGREGAFGKDVRIRFSEYDNAPAPLDGIAIDDVLITAEADQRSVLELPTSVTEGTGPHTGYVLLSFAPTNSVTLNLTVSPGDQLMVPATVEVPAGQTYASFSFSVANDDRVNLTRSVFLRAEAPGITPLQSAVTILDDEAPLLTLTLPTQLFEGEFPRNNASVSLDRAADVPLALNFTIDPWEEIDLSYNTIIPAGVTNAVFTIGAANDNRIDGTVSVAVTVRSPGATSVTAQTSTLDNETRSLALRLPSTVLEGRSSTGIVALSGTWEADIQIQLTSADPTAVSLPGSVTIPAGALQAEFTMTTTDNLIQDGSRSVAINASASTFIDASAAITIRDNEVATYRFSGLTDIVDIGRPIQVTVSAADSEGNVISGVAGDVNLSVLLGDGTTQLVTPPSVHLTGTTGWAGNITLPPVSAAPLRLRATDASGNTGDSIAFDTMRVLDLVAADLLWDSSRSRLYASVPANAGGTNANRVVAIDPATTGIVGSVATGQNPKKLALTSKGEILYVALDGNGTIARINPTTMTATSTFAVGTSPNYGTLYVEDMCAVAGQPSLLVVSQMRKNVSPGHNGVVAYDNGVARPARTQDHTGSNLIEPSANPGTFFGYNTESTEFGFRRLRLDASGMTEIEVKPNLFQGFFNIEIRSDGDKVFSTSGVELDGVQMRRLGMFPVQGPVCPELAANRVYFLEQQNPDYYWSDYDKIGVYDPATFSNIRRLTLPKEAIMPRSFIRWGTNGLAFITETNVVLINSSRLVPNDPPANLAVTANATPNPATVSIPLLYTVTVSNQGPNTARNTLLTVTLSDSQMIQNVLATIGTPITSSNAVTLDAGELAAGASATLTITAMPDSAGTLTCTAVTSSEAIDPDFTDNSATKILGVGFQSSINAVNRLRLAANNLIYDPTRNLLWASLPASVEAPLGKTIVSIDPTTGFLSDPIPIHGNPVPQCMALSANGRYLYVGLSDVPEVHRIDLNTPSISLRIPLGLSQWGSENYAQDIEPLDGDGTSFLMTGSSDHAAAVYDGLVRRSNRTGIYSVDRIERTGTPGVFVGYNSYTSGFQISSLAVTPAGVSNTLQTGNVLNGYYLEIRGAGNLLLSSSGLLVDSANLTLNANLGFNGRPCLDLPNHRAYIVHENTLSGFDTTTLLPTGDFQLPFTTSAYWPSERIEACIRWGLDGFAYLDSIGNIHIWRWSEAIPSSTDANADGISDAWEATHFSSLNVDPAGDDDGDGIRNFLEYLFVTSPLQASANPLRTSTITDGDARNIRLVFPRRAELPPRLYDYVISSDLTQWVPAPDVSETVISSQTVDGVRIETIEALIPASNPVSGFIQFRWNPR